MYHRGGSFTELGIESNCKSFAKSLKLKAEDESNSCLFPFTQLNSMSAVRHLFKQKSGNIFENVQNNTNTTPDTQFAYEVISYEISRLNLYI